MKNAFWAYWLILLGISIVVIMLLVQSVTSNNQQDYFLVKELAEAAMLDAVDYSYYRQFGEVKMNKEKFYENFIRRFAENASLNNDYKIGFYDVYEAPPKASIQVTGKSDSFTVVAGESTDFDIVNRLDVILEGNVIPEGASDVSSGNNGNSGVFDNFIESRKPKVTKFYVETYDLTSISVAVDTETGSSKSKIKKYYYKLGDGNWIESNSKTYTFRGLKAASQYELFAKVKDEAGKESDVAIINNAHTKSVVAPEANKMDLTATQNSVTASLTEYKKGDNNVAKCIFTLYKGQEKILNKEVNINNNTCSYTFTGLTANTDYKATLSIKDTAGKESNTLSSTIKTTSNGSSKPVENQSSPIINENDIAIAKNKTSLAINVSNVSSNSKITNYYFKINNDKWINSKSNKYTFNNLTANTTYKIQIYVKDSNNKSSNTIVKNVKTSAITVTNYTVSFNGNGGTPSTKAIIKQAQEVVGTLPTVSRAGYNFLGWYTSKNNGTLVSSNTKVTKNATYYAHWELKPVRICYHPNGGTVSSANGYGTNDTGYITSSASPYNGGLLCQCVYDSASSGKSGKNFCSGKYEGGARNLANYNNSGALSISRTGYKAVPGAEWRNNSYKDRTLNQGTNYTYSQLKEKANPENPDKTFLTLYIGVNWEKESYTVTFNGNGGTPSTKTITKSPQAVIGTLPTVSRAGYNFLGWYTSKNNGTLVSSNTKVTKNATYYAHWELKPVRICYHPNGGTVLSANGYGVHSTGYITSSASPYNGGLLCQCVYDSASSGKSGKNFCSGKYEGGTRNLINYNSSGALSISRTGYKAVPGAEWRNNSYKDRTLNQGTNYTYSQLKGKANPENPDKTFLTLYIGVNWEKESYTVTFNGNGGTPTTQTKKVKYQEKIGTLSSASQEDYSFLGWYTAKTGGEKISANTKISKNVTYYAHWEALPISKVLCPNAPSNINTTLSGIHGYNMVTNKSYSQGYLYKEKDLKNKISYIGAGAEFTILGESGNKWYVALSKNNCGWVNNDYMAINLNEFIPEVEYNITNNKQNIYKILEKNIPNVTGKRLYNDNYKPILVYSFAKQLKSAAAAAKKDGYTFVVYDAYRPRGVTKYLYNTTASYVNNNPSVARNAFSGALGNYLSAGPSAHNTACAIDVTLKKNGTELKMQSPMHELSKNSGISKNGNNANILAKYMTGAGMDTLFSEWWHFEDYGKRSGSCHSRIKQVTDNGAIWFWAQSL